jgi:hypothetical protein
MPMNLSKVDYNSAVDTNYFITKKHSSNTKMLVFVCIAFIIVICICFKKSNTITTITSPKKEPPKEKITPITVLNSIYKNDELEFEHIIYFTLQESADNFKFYIDNKLISSGDFESLDVRYDPPFRRVVLATKSPPNLPLTLKVEAFHGPQKIGSGILEMTKSSYHKKN